MKPTVPDPGLDTWTLAPAATYEDGTAATSDSGAFGPAPTAPTDGPRLPDRYEDRGRLGEGGIGEVRRVYDRKLGATLAMKLLLAGEHISARKRARFLAEARVTARLSHPGIVAVQDLGELADGRPWFTMEEVRGRTLTEVLLADRHEPLRRRMEIYLRVCEAVAYAHSVGVVHRDLKPDNVMVGAFGEVRVMDWGLARVLSADLPTDNDDAVPDVGTSAGVVMGTPGYMPPEQAEGRSAEVGPAADVYALGAILYTLLLGERPYAPLSGRQVLAAMRRGPPRPVRAAGSTPEPLAVLCDQAMAEAPEDRPADARALAQAVREWLEGARKEAEARVMVERALAQGPAVQALEERARALEAEAARVLANVPPFAPVEEKLPGWHLEAQAAAARQEAQRIEEALHRDLRAAVGHAPQSADAHAALADLYKARLIRAEARGEPLAASDAEALLREHDRGAHAAWLDGQGAVSLVTVPAGATVEHYRYVEQDRRLVEVYVGTLGTTPLHAVPLPRGSHLLVLTRPGSPASPVRYPVSIGRGEHWDGRRPGDAAPTPIWLPPALAAAEQYVPAGWFSSGGDTEALDGLPARRLWVDGFVILRDPITHAEYAAYLDALVAAGEDEAPALPRPLTEGAELFRRVDGRYQPGVDPQGLPLHPLEPVTFVTPEQIVAYADWRAGRDGLPWRLPHDQEWEKAARGVDGRAYPWGNRFEPTWTRMQSSVAGPQRCARIDEIPMDVGPYGLRGAAGNVRTLCQNGYRRGGPEDAIVSVEPAGPEEPYRMVRGGSWTSNDRLCRLAGRTAVRPGTASSVMGIRLVRSVP